MSFDDNSGRRDNRRFGGGYRGGGRRFNNDREFDDRPKPVETGKEYDVSITET